jgi:hypothetical protein
MPVSRLLDATIDNCVGSTVTYTSWAPRFHGYMPAAGCEKSMFPHYSEHKDKDTNVNHGISYLDGRRSPERYSDELSARIQESTERRHCL